MTALVMCLFPSSRMSGRISGARAGGRGVSQAVDWTETGRKPWAVSLDGPRECLPVSVKGAGRSCLETREAIKPMTPRLPGGRLDHWQVQTQQARNTPRAVGTGHTVRVPVRFRGIEVHSTRTRQRHGLFFPFQAPCLVQVLLLLHMSVANTIFSCKPGAHHRFLTFLLILFLRHACASLEM